MAVRNYAGGELDRAVALRRAKAICMAEARRRRVAYPIPPTKRVGMQPPPGVGLTNLLTPVVRSRVDERYYFEVTPEMEALPTGTEVVDGVEVDVRPAVIEKDEDVEFRVEEIDAPSRRGPDD